MTHNNITGKVKKPFAPMLLKAEVSTDLASPGDILWVTAEWQNTGEIPADRPLRCFMEMEFGNQRILENGEKYHRKIWEPQPGMEYWDGGNSIRTSCSWKIPNLWGGTYRLYLGICDWENVPFGIIGEKGQPAPRVYIGNIEISWGWGMALIEIVRRPWSRQFNPPAEAAVQPAGETGFCEISGRITVFTDEQKPMITGLGIGKREIFYSPLEFQMVIRDYEKDELIYSYQPGALVQYERVELVPQSVAYKASFQYNGIVLAEYVIKYTVTDKRLTITLSEINETAGYELLEIKMPCLVSMEGENVTLVDFFGGGRLVPLAKARPAGYVHNYDTRNAAAVYNNSMLAVLECYSLDDKLYVMVEDKGSKRAVLGASFVNKIRGRNKVKSIEVPNTHRIDVELMGGEGATPDWMDFARLMRQGLESKNRDVYRRSQYCVYYATQGPAPEPWQVREDSPYPVTRLNKGLKFNQILRQLEKHYYLLDGMRQIPFIYGYNRQNDETGRNMSFPYAYETDPRAGTLEELRECIVEAEKFNTYVSLYENYDDLYLSKYADMTYAAQDEYGEPVKGWIWADGLSYIIGNRKYYETGAMAERVQKMLALYGPRKSAYIDVLTSEVLRWDFNPEYAASAETSLQYRRKIIEEFNKYGIDVVSETLVQPYVGYMGSAYHTRINREEVLFDGESYIPLIPAVYHGTICYSADSGTRTKMLKGLIDGGSFTYELDSEGLDHIKWVYLHNIPLSMLYDEKMEEFREEGEGQYFIGYTSDSHIKVDLNRNTYEIVHNGRIIGKDWTTFTQGFRESSYLAFSLYGGPMSYKAPEGWYEGISLKAVVLTAEGEGEELTCRVKDGRLNVNMPADSPVRVIPV